MDRHRIGTFTRGGRFTSVFDLNDGSSAAPVSGTFKVLPMEETSVVAKASRRYGGSKKVAEIHDNGAIEAEFYLGSGASADAALAKFDDLVTILEDSTTGYYYEWRPEGATRSVYFELRGLGPWEPMYRWVEFAGTKRLHVAVKFQVAPLALGDPMDVFDDFSTNTIGDYTFDALTNEAFVSQNVLFPTNVSLTSERRLYHSARGYTHRDGQYTVQSTPGTTITGYKVGRYFKRPSSVSNYYLEVYVDDNGTNSRLRIDKVEIGVRTNLQTTNLGARISSGTPFWVRGRIERNVVYAEYFTSRPTPMTAPTSSLSHTLSTSEALIFGSGVSGYAGLSWVPQHASATVDDYEDLPYTYRAFSAPAELDLLGIPGTAPALVDAHITPSTSAQAKFALLGWAPKPAVWNMVQTGDFERGTSGGWSYAAVTNINAASDVLGVTSAGGAKYGQYALQLIPISGNADSGVNYRIWGPFKRGVTYTASVWLRAPSGSPGIKLRLGNGAANDKADSGTITGSTTWQQATVTWTPSADRADAHVAIIRPTAGSTSSIYIDGVSVYEGTTAPTSNGQSEGRGAFPPIAVIEANNAVFEGTPATVSDGGASNGDFIGASGVTLTDNWAQPGAVSIDPSLIAADDFLPGELAVEVWARVAESDKSVTNNQYKYRVSVWGSTGALIGSTTYSLEWGQDGRTAEPPVSGGGPGFSLRRLGTIVLPYDPKEPGSRWTVSFEVALPESVPLVRYGFDYFILVPVRSRAANPTGKTGVPAFVTSNAFEVTRVIKSNLAGYTIYKTNAPQRDSGLAGAPVEFPPGDVRTVVHVQAAYPDRPTSADTGAGASHSATAHFAVQPRYHLVRSE
jgi:hypothetical protein